MKEKLQRKTTAPETQKEIEIKAIVEKHEKGSQKWKEMRTTTLFQYLKNEKLEQIKKDGIESTILGDGTRIKNPQENPEDKTNEEYVEINRYIFMLENFMNIKATPYEKKEIQKIIYGPIPLTIETFLKMKEKRKTAILGMVRYLKNKHNLTEHWREDFEWALAEMTMVNIIPKFLNRLTDCNCIAIRANRFDDIKNKTDIFIISKKKIFSKGKDFYLPYNIALDVTLKKLENLQTKKDKLIRLNTRKPTNIKYGLQYKKEGGVVRSEISELTWFYTKIDWYLFQKYIIAVNENNKKKIEEIEEKIFINFCQNIKEQFQKLQEKRDDIRKDFDKLMKKKKKYKRKNNKIREKQTIEKIKNNRQSNDNLNVALENAHPFIKHINNYINLNNKKRYENFNTR